MLKPDLVRCLAGLMRPLVGVVVVGLSGCAGGPEGHSPKVASGYSTAYLGPNGEILYMTTSPAVRKHKLDLLPPAPEPQWSWNGDGVAGAPSIVVRLGAQMAYFYKGGIEVGRTQISTGREGFGTPTGSFSVMEKQLEHLSSLYGDYVDQNGEVVVENVDATKDRRPPGTHFQGAPMPYFLRVHGGVGLHAGYLPGYPASHGCIRLPRAAANKFFENAKVGMPVSVVP